MSSPESVSFATFLSTIRHRRLPTRRVDACPYAYVGVAYSGGTYVDVGVGYHTVTYHGVTYTYEAVTCHGVTYDQVTYCTVSYRGVTYTYVTVTYGYVGKGCH